MCLCIGFNSLAQINEKEAFQTFKQAREAYKNEQYEKASTLLLKTKKLLGNSNVRIQPMLIKSLAKIEDWRQAETEIGVYYKLNPDEKLVEFQDIKKLEGLVNQMVIAEENAFQRAKSDKSVSQYKDYLNKYPYGKHRLTVENLLQNQKDENAWQKAVKEGTTASYYQYLNKYREGNYAAKAKEQIQTWDDNAYSKAVNDGSQEALNYYLKNYPRGDYRNQIRIKLRERKELDVYQTAKSSGNLKDYESYATLYPDGKYINEAQTAIENAYYRAGIYAFKNKYYSLAERHFEKYMTRFPTGKHIREVTQKMKIAKRKLKQFSSTYIAYSFEVDNPYGFSIGRLNTKKAGFYTNFKFNSEVFTAANTIYSIEDDYTHTSDDVIVPSGMFDNGNVGISMGLTYKVIYPFWIYGGLGVNYAAVSQRIYNANDDWDTEWFFNTSRSSFYVAPEVGLTGKLFNKIMIKYGVVIHNGETRSQVGLGLAFGYRSKGRYIR